MLKYFVASLLWVLCVSALAGEIEDDGEPASRKHPHGIHRHNFEAFTGCTYFPGIHETTLFTLGVDYEHRFRDFHNHFGIGVLIDYEFANIVRDAETLVTPTLIYFPTKLLKIFGGVGCAFEEHRAPLLLWRVGAGYEFDVTEHIVVSPTISADFTKVYSALVFGVAFGIGI